MFEHAEQVMGSARTALHDHDDDHCLLLHHDDVELVAPSALPIGLRPFQPVGRQQPFRVPAGRHPAAVDLPQPGMGPSVEFVAFES